MPRRWTRLWTSQLLLNPPDVVLNQPVVVLCTVASSHPRNCLGHTQQCPRPGLPHSATIEVGDAMSVAVPHASDSLLTPQLQSISCARSALWFGTVAAAGLAARKTPEEKHRRNRFARTALQHGYTRSWDILLAAWAKDDFTTMWFGTQSSPILTCFYSSAPSSHFGMFQENRY